MASKCSVYGILSQGFLYDCKRSKQSDVLFALGWLCNAAIEKYKYFLWHMYYSGVNRYGKQMDLCKLFLFIALDLLHQTTYS